MNRIYGPLYAASIFLQSAVGSRNRTISVAQEWEAEMHFCGVRSVGFDTRRIDADCLYSRVFKLCHLIAHGGELAVSARSVVPRIKEECDVATLEQAG